MKYAVPLVLCLAACTNHLPLVGAPCPCAAGTVCEKATQKCVAGPDAAVDAVAGDTAVNLPPPAPEPDGGWDPDVVAATPEDAPTELDNAAMRPQIEPPACSRLGFHSTQEFETGFMVPRCGSVGCHQAVFPPRNLDVPRFFWTALVDVPAVSLCKNDLYINTANPAKSFMLAKVLAQGESVQCPSGGAANSGGTRMPNSMPAIAGPRLTDDEIACYTWWVYRFSQGL